MLNTKILFFNLLSPFFLVYFCSTPEIFGVFLRAQDRPALSFKGMRMGRDIHHNYWQAPAPSPCKLDRLAIK
jgi:hypothetical protein